MDYTAVRQEVNRRITYAEVRAPKDPFTRLAIWLTKGIQKGLRPVNYAIPLTTRLLAPIVRGGFTTPVYSFLLTILWFPGYMILLGTSWAWVHVAVVRPFLVLPMPIFSMLGYLFFALLPDPKRNTKYWHLALCDSWPLTWMMANEIPLEGEEGGTGAAPKRTRRERRQQGNQVRRREKSKSRT